MNSSSFSQFRTQLVAPYQQVDFIRLPSQGYVVWRVCPNFTTELVHIEAFKHRIGIGTDLVKQLVDRLKIAYGEHGRLYGFARANNEQALQFYRKLGFDLTVVPGFYWDGGGNAVLFSKAINLLRF